MNFFRKVWSNSIEAQIILSFCTLTAIIISLAILAYTWTRQMIAINELREICSSLKENQMRMKSASNDFILREKASEHFFSSGQSVFLERYAKFLAQLHSNREKIETKAGHLNESDQSELENLKRAIRSYDQIFVQMVKKIKRRGYDSYGLIGEFDKCIQQLLKYNFGADNSAVLNLQLFVKNYLLTGDEKISSKISDEAYMFTLVLEKHVTDEQVAEVSQILFNYETVFKQLVEIDRELGIYTGEGLEGKLFAASDEFDAVVNLEKINIRINQQYEKILVRLYLCFFLIISAAILTALTLNQKLYNSIVVPIQEMKSVIAKMSRGEVPKTTVEFRVNDLNDMAIALNTLVACTRNYQEFANNIGNGNLDTVFKPLSDEDILGISLLSMRNNLKTNLADQRLQLVELQRVNNELDNFTYHASHDLRAPLSSIQGLVNLGLNETSIEVMNSYFKMIQNRVNHMDVLLKDLIFISYNNKTETNFEAFDFDQEVKALLKSLEHPGIAFDVQLDIKQHASFLSDPVRVRTILSNLLSNAFKYYNPAVEKHYIVLSILVTVQHATLKVTDNGIGIDDAYKEKIYDMFFRATTRSTGTGLGLYIVKSMIDRLQGEIILESQLDEGTTFEIRIPNHAYSWYHQKSEHEAPRSTTLN